MKFSQKWASLFLLSLNGKSPFQMLKNSTISLLVCQFVTLLSAYLICIQLRILFSCRKYQVCRRQQVQAWQIDPCPFEKLPISCQIQLWIMLPLQLWFRQASYSTFDFNSLRNMWWRFLPNQLCFDQCCHAFICPQGSSQRKQLWDGQRKLRWNEGWFSLFFYISLRLKKRWWTPYPNPLLNFLKLVRL